MSIRTSAAFAVFASLVSAQEFRLGSTVTDFSVRDLAGAETSFAQLKGSLTVVAFISITCPISIAFNDRMNALYQEYRAKGVHFVFVDSNANEPAGDIIAHAKSAGFNFPIYKDPDNRAADSFGAMATPETFVVDAAGVVRYHGYIDDSPNPARVRVHGLKSALDAILVGKEVASPETKAFGCSIKRVRRPSKTT